MREWGKMREMRGMGETSLLITFYSALSSLLFSTQLNLMRK
jgi:hypothetical protein